MTSSIRLVRRMVAVAAAAAVLSGTIACTGQATPGDDPASVGGPSSGAGSSSDASPRPMTTEEAQRLSIMRFTNFDTGIRSIGFELAEGGTRYELRGWVDYVAGLGYATLRADGDAALIVWSDQVVGSHATDESADADTGGTTQLPPLPPPVASADDPTWTTSDLSPNASRLHAALSVILAAGHDRPDNPLLLQQTDARWLRSDQLDGDEVDVVAGPTSDHVFDPETSAGDGSDATVRYWIGRDGALHRMEVRLGGSGEWTVIDFGAGDGVEFAGAFDAGAVAG